VIRQHEASQGALLPFDDKNRQAGENNNGIDQAEMESCVEDQAA